MNAGCCIIRCWCTLLVACAVPASASSASSPQELMNEAVSEYRAALDCSEREERLARFRRAELLFTRLADGQHDDSSNSMPSADLFANLGNAAMGAERLGPAILAYRRALVLDPDHHRAQQNLRHARTLLPDWVPRPSEGGLLDTFFAWSNRLALGELQLIAAVAFLMSAGLIAAWIRWRQPALRNLAVIPAGGWLLLLLLLWLISGDANRAGDAAVVTVSEVVARSADSTGAPARFPQPLPGGTELEVIETRDGWAHVRLLDSRDAWVLQSAIQPVIGS